MSIMTTGDLIGLLDDLAVLEVRLEESKRSFLKKIEQINQEMTFHPDVQGLTASVQMKRNEIEAVAVQLQSGAKGKEWKVVYRNGANRRAWDLDKLDDFLDSLSGTNTELWGKLSSLRHVTVGKPSTTIDKVKKESKDVVD